MTSSENLQNVVDVFQMLHDGSIIAFEGNNLFLRLKIECLYLAEMINPEFEFFYVDLFEVTKFDLDAWQNPIDLPPFVLHGFQDVLKAELEITGADIIDDHVRVFCHQHDTNYNYCGGNLLISCSDIKMYDQELREFTVAELDEICNAYWNRARD